MKYLSMISLSLLFFSASYAQESTTVHKTFKSDTVATKGLMRPNNFVFTAITEQELINSSFFSADNPATEFTAYRSGFETPGYAPAQEMMSTTTMYSTIGNLKFYCNYYFDENGELQDGDISIIKKK